MKAKLYLIPILLVSAACQQMEIDAPDNKDNTQIETTEGLYSITIQAAKSEGGSKALDLVNDGATLNAYWKSTEKVKVYKDGALLGILDLAPSAGEKPVNATLSGSINVDGLAGGNQLTLRIPRDSWDYTGQVGTLAIIEASYDYATATVTIAAVDNLNHTITTTGPAIFANEQSVYRFGFKVGGNYIDPKSFTVSASNGALVTGCAWNGSAWSSSFGPLTITPASAAADHFYYTSIRNESTVEDNYSFVVTGSDDALYMGAKTIPASVLDVPGKFISTKSISVSKPDFAPASGDVSDPASVL